MWRGLKYVIDNIYVFTGEPFDLHECVWEFGSAPGIISEAGRPPKKMLRAGSAALLVSGCGSRTQTPKSIRVQEPLG